MDEVSNIKRDGFCPTCGQHHLAESDTEELHAMLAKCERLEREVLAKNERLEAHLAGAVEENERLRVGIQAVLDLRSSVERDRGNDARLVGNLQARGMLERLAGRQ